MGQFLWVKLVKYTDDTFMRLFVMISIQTIEKEGTNKQANRLLVVDVVVVGVVIIVGLSFKLIFSTLLYIS